MIVVDASIFLSWLLNEQSGSARDDVWDLLASHVALVPAHWPNEVANALRRAVRRKRIAADEIATVVAQLEAFNIRLAEQPLVAHIASLVEHALASDLSVYDLQYVELAQSQNLPLATMDAAMRAAALKDGLTLLPESL